MRLRIYNCSPRGTESNSRILSGAFARGFCELPGNTTEEFLVASEEGMEKGLASFGEDGVALVVFPVYVDAMPGLAKKFIESIAHLRGCLSGTRLLFLIHTGFPEETHTRPMERYLKKLAERLEAPLDGIIRMGGSEGIRRHSSSSRRIKLLEKFRSLGQGYAENGKIDGKVLDKLAGPARIPQMLAWLILPFVNYFGLGRELRRNGAYERRFNRPL